MMEKPLITVGVLTYNSSEFVIETLDSIADQSYDNIELIISDDCSSDDTVERCRDWIIKKSGFIGKNKIELVTVDNNTGTAGNCQRVLDKSNGEWIKFLGADDMLFSDAIEKYVNYVTAHPEVKVVCGLSAHFDNSVKPYIYSYDVLGVDKIFFKKEQTAKRQHSMLSKRFFGSGPTSFFNKDAILDIGGFDYRFPLIEDHPLFLNLTKNGYRINLLKDYTVRKRVHENSVIHQSQKDSILNKQTIRCLIDYDNRYLKEHMSFFWRIALSYSELIKKAIIKRGNNKEDKGCRILAFISKYTDPFEWYFIYLVIYSKLIK